MKRDKEDGVSRTYRMVPDWKMRAYGRDWTWDEAEKAIRAEGLWHDHGWTWNRWFGWKGTWILNRNARDEKPWGKPPKWFKQQNRRWERKEVEQAMKAERYEALPLFRKSDRWEWT